MADKVLSEKTQKTHILVESAVMIALATVLSFIKVYEAPFGGSVTLLSMAPIVLLSIRRGIRVGLPGAFVYSVLQLLLGISNVAWVPTAEGIVLCVLFDYLVPFTLLGLGGIFRNVRFSENRAFNSAASAVLGTLLVVLLRFLCHIVSGVAVWYALDLEWYADDPAHIVHQYGAWMFSLIYNGAYMLPEIVETVVGVPILNAALSKFKIR